MSSYATCFAISMMFFAGCSRSALQHDLGFDGGGSLVAAGAPGTGSGRAGSGGGAAGAGGGASGDAASGQGGAGGREPPATSGTGGANATPSTGGQGGSAAGGAGGGQQCVVVDAGVTHTIRSVPANVVILFDRSGSMRDDWSTGMPKWIDARAAVSAALAPLQADLAAVGALLFPRGEGDFNECAVDVIDSGFQFDFDTGSTFLQRWDAYWSQASVEPSGATPLLTALEMTDEALFTHDELRSDLKGPTIVMVITDGQPNCSEGVATRDEPLEALTFLPSRWRIHGIRTYVIGLPDENLAEEGLAILDGIARAGGTGQHIPANDPEALREQITRAVEEATTSVVCER